MIEAGSLTRDRLGSFVLGTTRLGDSAIARDERLRLASDAHRRGLWFHTSARYGDATDVIREAAVHSRTGPPRCIVKVGWNDPEELELQVEESIEALGVECLAVAQLCLDGALAKDFATGGTGCEVIARLRAEGRVERCVLQVFPWSSAMAVEAYRRGHASQLVDGAIFYFNPLQRCCSTALWNVLVETRTPIIAMRTLAGGDLSRMMQGEGNTPDYLIERARTVEPLLAASGAVDWVEFAVRFALSTPGVVATVGATVRQERLERLVRESREPVSPLPSEIVSALLALQREWSDEFDARALPGSL